MFKIWLKRKNRTLPKVKIIFPDVIALPYSSSMFGCEILCYYVRVISLFIQNESIDLRNRHRNFQVVCFVYNFIAFEMAPKRVQIDTGISRLSALFTISSLLRWPQNVFNCLCQINPHQKPYLFKYKPHGIGATPSGDASRY